MFLFFASLAVVFWQVLKIDKIDKIDNDDKVDDDMPCSYFLAGCMIVALLDMSVQLGALVFLVMVNAACPMALIAYQLALARGSRLTWRERVGYTFFSAWVLGAPTWLLLAMATYAYGLCFGQLWVRHYMRWDHHRWMPCLWEWIIGLLVVLAGRALWCAMP